MDCGREISECLKDLFFLRICPSDNLRSDVVTNRLRMVISLRIRLAIESQLVVAEDK